MRPFGTRHTTQRETGPDVGLHSGIQQQRLLEHHRHPAPVGEEIASHRPAVKQNLTRRGALQESKDVDEGALAGAVRANHGQHLAGGDVKLFHEEYAVPGALH